MFSLIAHKITRTITKLTDSEQCANLLLLLLLLLLQRVSIACYAKRCTSYRKYIRLSVRHTLALCQNDSSYDHGVYTVG